MDIYDVIFTFLLLSSSNSRWYKEKEVDVDDDDAREEKKNTDISMLFVWNYCIYGFEAIIYPTYGIIFFFLHFILSVLLKCLMLCVAFCVCKKYRKCFNN